MEYPASTDLCVDIVGGEDYAARRQAFEDLSVTGSGEMGVDARVGNPGCRVRDPAPSQLSACLTTGQGGPPRWGTWRCGCDRSMLRENESVDRSSFSASIGKR